MRIFTVILLTINLGTIAWIHIGTRLENPPWKQSFQDTKSVIESIGSSSTEMYRTMADLARVRLETTEEWTTMTMDGYQRNELPLHALALCNIAGLAIIALRKGKPNQPWEATGDNAAR